MEKLLQDNSPEILTSNTKLNSRLIFILIALVGFCLFLTESKTDGFTPGGLYSGVSVHGLTLSKNLLHSDHYFFMYTSREYKYGKKIYDAYNRFPVFPFLVVGLLTQPFESDPIIELYAARQIMNLYFFLSILIVFKLVNKILKNSYVALSVTLLSFSSYYLLSYNNMIFNDIPALLGFVIALYAVISAQNKKLRTREILFYSLFPICLGWQPYAVYAAWFLFDLMENIFKRKASLNSRFFEVVKKPSFIITAIAVVWGICILGLQLMNEWRVVGGSFLSIPSLNSALWRSGFITSAGHTQFQEMFNWVPFLSGEARAMTVMLIPYFPIFQIEPGYTFSIVLVLFILIYLITRYFNQKTAVNKFYIISALSGLFWAIPMRRFVSLHDFQSIFYIGFVISAYCLWLSGLKLKAWKFLAIDITVVFLITVALSNYYKSPNMAMNNMIPEFQSICQRIPVDSRVYFDGDRKHAVQFARFGVDFFLIDYWYCDLKSADYIISKNPDYVGVKLTSNPGFNLFKAQH